MGFPYKTKTIEFPPALCKQYKKAIRYEWISFIYMISAAIVSYLAMSNSQTMKTIWLEDCLGIIPPASYLLASKFITRPATRNFPYGFHETLGISYLASSLALFFLGIYLLLDGLLVLFKGKHPDVPTIHIFNHPVWLGYIMILSLLWSSIPSTILGHIKIGFAKALYDKVLFADSKMNKASWLDGFASIIGVIGIGFGLWWADAAMAVIISSIIISDGYKNLRQSIFDLINEVPKSLGKQATDPLIAKIKELALQEGWVDACEVRCRDVGHVFFGEVFIHSKQKSIASDKIVALKQKIEDYHWRLHDIVITIVS